MASYTALHMYLLHDPVEGHQIHVPKQTAIDKIGGILCHICNSIFGNKKDYDNHYAVHKVEGAEIVYTCVACKKHISSYPSFRGHCYLNHVVKDKFQCNHCNKSFSKLSILNSHISAVHEYKCGSCDDKFSTKKDLEAHKIIHGTTKKVGKDEPPYNCLLCSKLITTMDEYESHIDDHCEIHYPCPICKEVLPNKMEATKHLTIHFDQNMSCNILADPENTNNLKTHLDPNISSNMFAEAQNTSENSSIDILGGILCCHCDLLFPNRLELDTHFMVEHEDKTIVYSCNICEKQYEKYAMFGDHCYLHIARERFQCNECDKSFARLSLLVLHTEAFHTGPADKPFSCLQCGHGFKTRQRLKEHMRIVHEEEPPIRCTKPGCSATFSRPRELVAHAKRHAAALDTWCRQCGLQFASAAAGARHLDVHRRKQYACAVCRRGFRERYLVLKHAPTHFAAELHACKVCGKTYDARRRLVAHLKSHATQRSFACSLCSKSFLKPHELRQHLNVHAGQRPFACVVCPKSFANHPNWAKHMTRVHLLDKQTVRRLKAERDAKLTAECSLPPPPTPPTPTPPPNAADTSLSFCAFADSDDDRADTKLALRPETMSIAESVSAAISRIDSLDYDLDLMVGNKVEITQNEFDSISSDLVPQIADDTSDIKAIVEHIDAMTEGLEPAHADADCKGLQYADMTLVDDAVFHAGTNTAHNILAEASNLTSSWFPEYGPDFAGLGMGTGIGLGSDGFNLDEHALPHIDPRLTLRADDSVKLYLDNINKCGFGDVGASASETKVFKYEDNSDANTMYIY